MNDAQATELDIAPDFRERISQIELKLAKLNRAVFEDSKTGWEDYTVAGDGYEHHFYGDKWTRKRILEEVWKLQDFAGDYVSALRLGSTLPHYIRQRVQAIENLLEKPNNAVDEKDKRITELEEMLSLARFKLQDAEGMRDGYRKNLRDVGIQIKGYKQRLRAAKHIINSDTRHSDPDKKIDDILNYWKELRLESAKNKSDSLIPADEDMDNIKKLDEAKESRE